MANALWNMGYILGSLRRPREATHLSLELLSAPAASDTGPDVTLGKKNPAGAKTSRSAGASRLDPLAAPSLMISPAFKLVVILVFVLVFLFAAATILLAIFGDGDKPSIQAALTVMSTALTASLGAILGLIGGKAIV